MLKLYGCNTRQNFCLYFILYLNHYIFSPTVFHPGEFLFYIYVFSESFNATVSEFGHIDLLVNNAGIADESRMEDMIRINLVW